MGKKITLTHLTQVLQKIGAYTEDDLSRHHILEAGLDGHMTFHKPGIEVPVTSERRRFTGIGILITNLKIDLDYTP